jgi:SulP family sulfate permease
VPPKELYALLRSQNGDAPLVLDVREPSEYRRGHIPEAILRPLVTFVDDDSEPPPDDFIVLVCRTGRRSRRAAAMLAEQGYSHVTILDGGMLAWEAAGLLEAVDYFGE